MFLQKKSYFICFSLSSSLAFFAQAAQINIVASVPIVEDIVSEVTCHKLSVDSIVARNTDAHEFTLTPSLRKRIELASVLVGVGDNYDPWFNKASQARSASLLVLMPKLKAAAEENKKQDMAAMLSDDPHFWHSPSMVKMAANLIFDFIVKNNYEKKDNIKSCLDSYLLTIDNTRANLQTMFERLTSEQRVFATTHRFFSYFGREFGFEVVSAGGADSQGVLSPKQLFKTSEMLKKKKVRAIFYDSSESQKLAVSLSKSLKIKVGAELRVDTLGAIGSADSSIIRLWENNAKKIFEALQ